MMKCMVLKNEGIYLILLLYITSVKSFLAGSSQTIQALCSENRYVYRFQPGESYGLKVTSGNPGDSDLQANKFYRKSKHKCRKEFKTDGASHFSIRVSNMSIPSCSEMCNCNYFEISEPGNAVKFCGKSTEDAYFESKTSFLSIQFQHGASMHFNVLLTISVQRNTYIFSGTPKKGQTVGHFIETPFFPQVLQSNYVAEYILRSDDLSGHVMLMFLDFQLSQQSYIEVLGHNNTHPARFFGDVFRPPVLVSEANELNLKFEANNQLVPGFRAACFFLTGKDVASNRPFTECGGAKYGYSGFVSIGVTKQHSYYDCLWHLSTPLIPPVDSYFWTVSNITLDNIGSKVTLEFREGMNSKSKLVSNITCNNFNCSTVPLEVVIPASSGLFIRFNGLLNPDSVISMVYSTFRNGNCNDRDIICNQRCLLPAERCDGIQNCADGSDEQECSAVTEIQETASPPVIRKKLHTSTTETSFIIVLVFGVCGLVVVIIVIALAYYRHFKIAPSLPHHAQSPHIVQEMLAPQPQSNWPRSSAYYDQPPSYEDFIRTSEQYPPLLYTRTGKRHSAPCNTFCSQHTTSFCGKMSSTPWDTPAISPCHETTVYIDDPPEPGCSLDSQVCRGSLVGSMRKSISFDSVFNKDLGNDCHLQLSITHSISPSSCCSKKFLSLPTRLKISKPKPNHIDITFSTTLPDCRRKYPSCSACHDVQSEIRTTVKARCYSDPC